MIKEGFSMLMDGYSHWMKKALTEAKQALYVKEVPVGALVLKNNRIIGKGYNQVETLHDPTAHAEIIAITAAASSTGDWRLNDTVLFVTLEPCPMCAGAIMSAKIPLVVFGAFDKKYGACESRYRLCHDKIFNHSTKVVGGILQEECSALLDDFFSHIRSPGERNSLR